MKDYIVYDGRAYTDIDSASVMRVIQAKDNSEAKRKFKQMYRGYGYVLCDKEDNIIW